MPTVAQMREWVRAAAQVFAAGRLRWSVSIGTSEHDLLIVAALCGQTCVLLVRWRINGEPEPSALLGAGCTAAELGPLIASLLPERGERSISCLLTDRCRPEHRYGWIVHNCDDCPHGAADLLGDRSWQHMQRELAGPGIRTWVSAAIMADLIAATTALAAELETATTEETGAGQEPVIGGESETEAAVAAGGTQGGMG